MNNHNIPILILGILLLTFIKAGGTLAMAFVPEDIKNGFYSVDYNMAKIRQACIEVHGEEWVKRAVLERKFWAASIVLSNAGFMQFSFRSVDPKDLQDFKDVIDYMAARNDTLYYGLGGYRPHNFKEITASPEALNKYLHECTELDKKLVIDPAGHFLRVGSLPDMTDPDLIILFYPFGFLWSRLMSYDISTEYEEKCEKEGYVDVSTRRFDKTKVTDRDLDLYYRYIVKDNKQLLATRPNHSIPMNVRYDATPNKEGFYIKWKYYPHD